MTSVFKGKDSDIEFQDCHHYDEDHEYVCFDCSLFDKEKSDLHDGNTWLRNALDAIEHLRDHIANDDVVPNSLIRQMQDVVKHQSFVHQSLMSPYRRLDGSHSGKREKAFHDQWWKEQENRGGSAMWVGLAQSWDLKEVSTREISLMASLITWLGTNVGFCFLENALKRCGYQITKIEE